MVASMLSSSLSYARGLFEELGVEFSAEKKRIRELEDRLASDRFLPRKIAIRRIKRWLEQDIESIILRNVGNLQFETYQNINDTFRHFASDLDEQLDEVGKATLGAIQEACNHRKEKGEIVSAELS